MIVGIGMDAVEISRFSTYKTRTTLHRIFTKAEIAYCLAEPMKSTERFAVRFAAKEALYKALTQANQGTPPCPFLTLCRNCTVLTNPAPIVLIADWHSLNSAPYSVLATLTHSKTVALAQIVIQKI